MAVVHTTSETQITNAKSNPTARKTSSVIELQRHICASEGNICPKLVGSNTHIQFVAHPCHTVEFGFSEFRSTHLHTCVLMKLEKGSLQMNSSSYCLSNSATLNIYYTVYNTNIILLHHINIAVSGSQARNFHQIHIPLGILLMVLLWRSFKELASSTSELAQDVQRAHNCHENQWKHQYLGTESL